MFSPCWLVVVQSGVVPEKAVAILRANLATAGGMGRCVLPVPPPITTRALRRFFGGVVFDGLLMASPCGKGLRSIKSTKSILVFLDSWTCDNGTGGARRSPPLFRSRSKKSVYLIGWTGPILSL